MSSTVSSWILRPFTPPWAFWASTRAWHALSESWKFGAAAPVPDQMKPSFTESFGDALGVERQVVLAGRRRYRP